MVSIESYVWLLPILFIFHDLEEIIGFKNFIEKHSLIMEKIPYFRKVADGFSTEGFALAVLEEFVIAVGICLGVLVFPHPFTYGIWLGAFIALTIHFMLHLIQAILLRTYVPTVVTSLICMPIAAYILYHVLTTLPYSFQTMGVFIVTGIILTFCNVFLAHKLMCWYTGRSS